MGKKLTPEDFQDIVKYSNRFPHIDAFENGEILCTKEAGKSAGASRIHVSVKLICFEFYEYLLQIAGEGIDREKFGCGVKGLAEAEQMFNDACKAQSKRFFLDTAVNFSREEHVRLKDKICH